MSSRRITSLEQQLIAHCAWNISANEARSRLDGLSAFDGFLRDPDTISFVAAREKHRIYSVSQLDLLVQCRFHYFVSRILGIAEDDDANEEEGLSPAAFGQIVHSILFGFYTQWVAEGRGLIIRGAWREAAEMMGAHTEIVLMRESLPPFYADLARQRLFGARGFETFLLGYDETSREAHGLLGEFLNLEIERAKNHPGLLRPRYFETGFGMPPKYSKGVQDDFSQEEPVQLKMGRETVRLRGRADRVDTDQEVFSLADYKTGMPPSIASQASGFKTQLPIYLMALDQIFASRGKPLTPAGGLFYHLTPKSAEIKGQFFKKQYHAGGGLSERQKLLSDVDFEDAMEMTRTRVADAIADARRGWFHVTLAGENLACPYCECAAICRKNLERTDVLIPLLLNEPNTNA